MLRPLPAARGCSGHPHPDPAPRPWPGRVRPRSAGRPRPRAADLEGGNAGAASEANSGRGYKTPVARGPAPAGPAPRARWRRGPRRHSPGRRHERGGLTLPPPPLLARPRRAPGRGLAAAPAPLRIARGSGRRVGDGWQGRGQTDGRLAEVRSVSLGQHSPTLLPPTHSVPALRRQAAPSVPNLPEDLAPGPGGNLPFCVLSLIY